MKTEPEQRLVEAYLVVVRESFWYYASDQGSYNELYRHSYAEKFLYIYHTWIP